MTESYVGRFAPSPTGPLHFGSLVTAVGSYADALAHGGVWKLRIDDVDEAREIEGIASRQLSTLEMLGFEWEGEPIRQTSLKPRYQSAIEKLRRLGLLYPCSCSRREIARIARRGSEGPVYPGTCRGGPTKPGYPTSLRLRTDADEFHFNDRIRGKFSQNIAIEIGDFVVQRVDGFTAYQLAVCVDDTYQGVTHIVRGQDLLSSTPRQILIQHLLEIPTPEYAHLPLVTDQNGEKLSKTDNARPVDTKQPIETLLRAWQFLGQLQPDTRLESINDFWDWVKLNWNIKLIP